MNKKNITFLDLAGHDFPGGCEKYFSILAKHFSSKNIVYFVESTQYVSFMERFYHILSGHRVGTIDYVKRDIGKGKIINLSFLSLFPFSNENRKIRSILNLSDIIYSKNEFQELLLLYYLLGKKKFSEKVIIGIHSAIFVPESVRGVWKFIHDLQYNSLIYKKFLKSAKFIHTINSDDEIRINSYYEVDKNKIKYIPYFIDWKTVLSKRRNNKKFIILWAGRLTLQKGIDRLNLIIDALLEDKASSNIEFWIAGGGEDLETVRKLEKKYKNVKFLGFIDNILKLYPKVNLAIVTSYFETFGYNVLEPQSFGIPVVCFDIEGPRDIVLQSKTGYLVKDNNEFIVRVNNIYMNKTKLINSKRIFNMINKRFSKEKIIEEMERKLLTND